MMPDRTLKTKQDCIDFLTGLKLLGTGGGGSPTSGLEMLLKALEEGLTLSWIDAAEMPDDVFSCTTFGSGSISEGRPENEEQINQLGKKLGIPNKFGHRAPEMAVRELEAYSGVKSGALVPVELGASNTPAPLVTAARLGISLIDGDYSGRAVPQEMQTTYFLKGLSISPAAVTDWWGDVVIIKEGASPAMIESMGKMLAISSHGVVFFASVLLSAKDTRETIVPGTLTRSFELGKAVHQAIAAGQNPVTRITEQIDGWELFSGVVTGKDWEDKEGAMTGTTHIQGTGMYAGHSMDIWFLNENHIAWLDNKPYVFSPDLIITANPETGEGYTNTELKAGDPVTVVGCKINPAFRSEKALANFAPRYWGFDIDYKPIEEVMS
ncbi:MAG: DUF917 domain-containing protein [Flexilinea sp.]